MYVELIVAFMQIGLLSIGGGYASLPHLQSIIVNDKGWLDMQMYVDLITLSQMTPGPLAINAASFVGMKVDGVLGALVATIANCLPSFVIVLALAWLYYRFQNMKTVQRLMGILRPIVVALIVVAAWKLVSDVLQPESFQWGNGLLFVACFAVLRTKKIKPIQVMLGAVMIGMITYLLR